MEGFPEQAFFVVADSPDASQTLRNICNAYEEAVVRRFGRAVLFEPTELGAFLAFRLRSKHGDEVHIGRAGQLREERLAYRRALEAARAFERRESVSTPYPKFAAGTEFPLPDAMADRPILDAFETELDEPPIAGE